MLLWLRCVEMRQISWESIEGEKEKEKISEQPMDKWSRVWPTGHHALSTSLASTLKKCTKGTGRSVWYAQKKPVGVGKIDLCISCIKYVMIRSRPVPAIGLLTLALHNHVHKVSINLSGADFCFSVVGSRKSLVIRTSTTIPTTFGELICLLITRVKTKYF